MCSAICMPGLWNKMAKTKIILKSWDVSNSYKIQIWLWNNTCKTYNKKLKHEINSYIMSCTSHSQCFSLYKNTFSKFKVKDQFNVVLSMGKIQFFLPQLRSAKCNAIFLLPSISFLTNKNCYWYREKKLLRQIFNQYCIWFHFKSGSGYGSSILDQCGSG